MVRSNVGSNAREAAVARFARPEFPISIAARAVVRRFWKSNPAVLTRGPRRTLRRWSSM
jgi:hypothetical protein